MRQKLITAQLNNFKTSQMYLRQCLMLAENVFEFPFMPKYIDTAYMNKNLLRKGSVAFFVDEVMGLLCLPYTSIGNLDVYGRPKTIQVIAQNGYTRILKQDEFVIMYDNNGRYPLYLDICQLAERLACATRTSDINIAQQKTPRIFKTNANKELSLRQLINNVDGFENAVMTYEDINLADDTEVILAPAPFVADKVDEYKARIKAEFLNLIGIANLTTQKKERVITDEVNAQMGGTVANRYSRFEPRKKAIDEINEKFKDYLERPIEVRYYDGLPDSDIKSEDYIDEEVKDEEEGGLNV